MEKLPLFFILLFLFLGISFTVKAEKDISKSFNKKYEFTTEENTVRLNEEVNLAVSFYNNSKMRIFNISYYSNGRRFVIKDTYVKSKTKEKEILKLFFSSTGTKKLVLEPKSEELSNKSVNITVVDEDLEVRDFNISRKQVEKSQDFYVNTTVENTGNDSEIFVGKLEVGNSEKIININKSIKTGKIKIKKELEITNSGKKNISLVSPNNLAIEKRSEQIKVGETNKKSKTRIQLKGKTRIEKDSKEKNETLSSKSSKPVLEIVNFSTNKNKIKEYKNIELKVKLKNNGNSKIREYFRIETHNSRNLGYINTKVEGKSTKKESLNFSLKGEGTKLIMLKPLMRKNITKSRTKIKVLDKEKGTFKEPLLSHFDYPPNNTQKINKTLYEDLDGDGESTDIYPTAEILLELKFNKKNFTSKLNRKQIDYLDWDDNEKLNKNDMLELYIEKKKLDRYKDNKTTRDKSELVDKLINIAIRK